MRILLAAVFVLYSVPSSSSQGSFTLPLSSLSFETFVRSKTNVPKGRIATISDIRITHFWKSPKHLKEYRLRNITRLLSDKNFNSRLPTVFYAHGYVEERDDLSVQTIVRAYGKRGDHNVLLLDWSNLAFGNYFGAAGNSLRVGKEAGRALIKLVKSGLDLEKLHLVGHSLGAHVCGAAARIMAAKGLVVPRLTGLDPALPGFYAPIDFVGSPMSETDARHVEAIHTDAGRYGTPVKTARADFWPNGGAHQPGCSHLIPFTIEEFCSHWRSWRFWAEAVTGGEFLACSCTSYDDFTRGSCSHEGVVLMGINTDTSAQGNFYLRTAPMAPFALGQRGAE